MFKSESRYTEDPDYQAVLKSFAGVGEWLKNRIDEEAVADDRLIR